MHVVRILPSDVVKDAAQGRVPYSYLDAVSQELPRNDVQGPFCGEIQMKTLRATLDQIISRHYHLTTFHLSTLVSFF